MFSWGVSLYHSYSSLIPSGRASHGPSTKHQCRPKSAVAPSRHVNARPCHGGLRPRVRSLSLFCFSKFPASLISMLELAYHGSENRGCASLPSSTFGCVHVYATEISETDQSVLSPPPLQSCQLKRILFTPLPTDPLFCDLSIYLTGPPAANPILEQFLGVLSRVLAFLNLHEVGRTARCQVL